MEAIVSYAEQTLHYFRRPHEGVPGAPIDSPAAWRARDLAARDDWRTRLSSEQIAELEAALAHARATGRPTGALERDDFPLPTLADEIARWRRAIRDGLGVHVVSGLPVERWTQADAEAVFWGLGLHMGRPGAQNPQGDLLGHVVDTGEDAADPWVRLYRTRADIAYHCDAADVVGLLCLRPAPRGGASRIASSVAVFNELVRRDPDRAAMLFEPFLLDVRNEDRSGALRTIPIPPCRFAGGRLRTFYHSDYFRSVERHADVGPLDPERRALMDLYESIASDPAFAFDMELAAGDVQWLSNHTVLHARTGYDDAPEPERKRHLLRLWLSLD